MDARALVIVADACGVGALPDAASYGDAGTNTLAHVAEAAGGLQLPAMQRLGLGSIVPLRGVDPAVDPAIHGRLHPLGPGKDSATGHWELMGAVLERPLPTYPDGFPPEVIARLVAAMGHEILCNRPYNGIAAIEDFGAEHMRTGALILYTSQDSVLQLAAHVDRVPPQELYRACAAARETMRGEHAIGRVIARPFAGEEGAFVRAEGRRDFALRPPGRSYLEALSEAGVEVHGVGKIDDLLVGRLIADQGYEVKLLRYWIDTVADFHSMRDLLLKRLRWMVVMRHMRPWGHIGLLFTLGLPWAIIAGLVAHSARIGLAYLCTYLALRIAMTWLIGSWGLKQRFHLRFLLLIPVWDALAVGIWLRSFTRNTINWRNHEYYIRDGELVPVGTAD